MIRTRVLKSGATVAVVGVLAISLVSLLAAPASAETGETDSGGFPLLGWLSFVAVVALGLMPVALWVRYMTSRSAPR